MTMNASLNRNRKRQLEYAKKREEERLQWITNRDRQLNSQINEIMRYAMETILNESQGWLVKYAMTEKISLVEARKRVSTADMKYLAQKAKKYVEEKDFSEQANEEMRLYNYAMKMSRNELLLRQMNLELLDAYSEVDKLMSGYLSDMSKEELIRQAGILGKTVSDVQGYAKQIANRSFHGATFSDRIWENQKVLRDRLGNGLMKSLQMGKHPTTWMGEMRDNLKEDFGNAAYALKRLAVTESARVQIEAQKAAYEANDYDQYMVICEPTACEICMPYDGKTEAVEKMLVGANAPPFHPNCKCSTSAYMDDLNFDDEESENIDNTEEKGYNKYDNNTLSQEGSTATIPKSMEGNFDDFQKLRITEEDRQVFLDLYNQTVASGYEHGCVITSKGHVIEFEATREDGVYMPLGGINEEGLKLFHSHTNDTPFSMTDFANLLNPKVSEIGVVTRNQDVFVASVGDGWIPTPEELHGFAKSIYSEINNQLLEHPEFENWSLEERNYMTIREQAFRITREFEWNMEGGKLNE